MSSHLDPAVAELHQVPGGRGPPELEVKELSVEKRRQTDFERDGSPASVVGHDGHFNALKRQRDAWNSGSWQFQWSSIRLLIKKLWVHNSAKIFRLVRQCMGLMTSCLSILRARSILSAFVVPKLILLFTTKGKSAQPYFITFGSSPTGCLSFLLCLISNVSFSRSIADEQHYRFLYRNGFLGGLEQSRS